MEAIQIRQALQEDFDAIYGFINTLENAVFDRKAQWEIYLENAGNPNNIYLMAFARNIPVGFLSCHIQHLMHHGGPVGEIQEMFVTEAARSLGIGKKLTDRLKTIARERDVLQLEVTSNLKRENAHLFYEREDFAHTHKKFVFKLK